MFRITRTVRIVAQAAFSAACLGLAYRHASVRGWPDPVGPWVVKMRMRPLRSLMVPCCRTHGGAVPIPAEFGSDEYAVSSKLHRHGLTVVTAPQGNMACARNAMCAIFDSTRETWGACLTYAGRPPMEAGSGLERWILWQLGASITTSKRLEECLPRDTCLIIEDLGLDRPLSEHPALASLNNLCKTEKLTIIIIQRPPYVAASHSGSIFK
jgi:hypothetical protein